MIKFKGFIYDSRSDMKKIKPNLFPSFILSKYRFLIRFVSVFCTTSQTI